MSSSTRDGAIHVVASLGLAACSARPNILMILTDDQSRVLDDLAHAQDEQHLARGRDRPQHVRRDAVCCPSRASIRGAYIHNLGVTNNSARGRLRVARVAGGARALERRLAAAVARGLRDRVRGQVPQQLRLRLDERVGLRAAAVRERERVPRGRGHGQLLRVAALARAARLERVARAPGQLGVLQLLALGRRRQGGARRRLRGRLPGRQGRERDARLRRALGGGCGRGGARPPFFAVAAVPAAHDPPTPRRSTPTTRRGCSRRARRRGTCPRRARAATGWSTASTGTAAR